MTLSGKPFEYLNEGFNPIPLWADKSPKLPIGHPYLYKPVRESDIPSLFSGAVKIGIVCGAVSHGFECIDFDGKDGEPIAEIFRDFCTRPEVADVIRRNNLPIVQTPSGGFHVYYRHEDADSPSQHLASWETGKVMIETRGNGGYVATIPSSGYVQLSGSSITEVSRLDRDDRYTLLAASETFTRKIKSKSERTSGGKWPDKFDVNTVWGRYNEEEVTEMKDILTENGWEYISERHDGVEYWQRPGKDELRPVTGATFGRFHNMFYCFTDSVDWFEQRTAYTPFDIYTHYKHRDNKYEAICALEKRYNMKSTPPAPMPPEPEPNASRFPVDVFPEDIQQFISNLNAALNYSPDFLSIAIMFTLATMNGNKYKLRVKETWNAPTVFWFAAVGDPGTMKSHPISTIIAPIEQIDREAKKLYDAEYLEYENKLAESKNKSVVRKPKFRQIKISDVTLEALHDVHGINKRGLGYYKDELVAFIKNMNQYRSGSDEEFWLESFNNKSYQPGV